MWLKASLLVLAVAVHVPPTAFEVPRGFQGGAEIARGQLLVATHGLRDPYFAQSVILLLRYDEKGTIGLILNHPTKISLGSAFPELNEGKNSSALIFIGGPVAAKNFFLLQNANKPQAGYWEVTNDLNVTSDPATIKKRLLEDKKEHFRLFAGCASWAPSQLEAEILEGSWNLLSADAESIFDVEPDDMWNLFHNRTALQKAQTKAQEDQEAQKDQRKTLPY